jgi:hypothetical protein
MGTAGRTPSTPSGVHQGKRLDIACQDVERTTDPHCRCRWCAVMPGPGAASGPGTPARQLPGTPP